MNNIPNELKKAICSNQLVLFVGAGLSYNLININDQPLKGWSNLVEQVLQDLKNNGYDIDFLVPLLSRYDPIKVLDLIESDKNIPKEVIYKFIKDFFDLNGDKNHFKLHKKLFQLSSKIITTNYDTAFEIAIPDLRKNRAYKGKNYELTTHKDPNAALLYKLHGCYEDVESMVLFPTNYDNLYKNKSKDAEHSLLVLRNIIYNKSVLFVGAGMGDFQINNIFKEFKEIQGEFNQKHFIITNKPVDSSLGFLTALSVKEYDEIESVIDSLISIKEAYGNKEPDEIIALKAQLEEANRKVEAFNSGDLQNKIKLLEREAIKYFSRGVEFNLANEHEKASLEYKTALELKPDYHEALFNWGTSLGTMAKTKKGKEAEDMHKEAFDKFQKTLDIEPDYHEVFNNWGNCLAFIAMTKEGKEVEDLFKEAIDKFQKAIDTKPNYHVALHNWGNCLGRLAKTKKGKEADNLYKESFDKFQKAIDINPDYYATFHNWGNCLVSIARTKEVREAEGLYKEAFDKYQKAIDIKPDFYETLNNWGTSLGHLAKTKEGKEAEDLYKEALDKLQTAIEYGASSYNLSCILALRGEKDEALKYLNDSLLKNEISVAHVEKDEDWKDYYADEEFKMVLKKYSK